VRHTLVARVQDQPGVLHRVVSLFRRRAFNVDSLTVGGSEEPGISRMTIVVETDRVPAYLVEANMRKLVPVIEVRDVTNLDTVSRDLALIRVQCTSAELSEINNLISIFRGRIVDVAAGSVIVEVTGDVRKVDGLVEQLRPRGILEMVRTGKVAMVRGSEAPEESEEELAAGWRH